MSKDTRGLAPRSASRTPTRLVGRLRSSVVQPDGSTVEHETTLEEKAARRPPHPYRDFMLASTEGLQKIATDLGKEMHGRDFRVLFHLLGSATFGNFIVPTQGEVARALELRPEAVCRSFKKLRDLGIIGLDPVSRKNKGSPKRWHLAPSLFWKGSAYSLSQVQIAAADEAHSAVIARARTRARRSTSGE